MFCYRKYIFFFNFPFLIKIKKHVYLENKVYFSFNWSLFISSSSSTSVYPLVLNISFSSLVTSTTKIFLATWKIKFSSKLVDGATRHGSTNSSSWKISSFAVILSLPSQTTWTWPLSLVFTTDNQSTLEQSFLKKHICVINLLALLH